MAELELTLPRLLSVWWLIMWRGVIGGFAVGFFIGFILGLVRAMAGFQPTGLYLNLAMGLVVGMFWWPFVTRMALKKHYKDFRIALIPREQVS